MKIRKGPKGLDNIRQRGEILGARKSIELYGKPGRGESRSVDLTHPRIMVVDDISDNISAADMERAIQYMKGLRGEAVFNPDTPGVGKPQTVAFHQHTGPNKPDKGLRDGSCNRTACQAPLLGEKQYTMPSYGSGSTDGKFHYCQRCRDDFTAWDLIDSPGKPLRCTPVED
jgi:hypothetical protein